MLLEIRKLILTLGMLIWKLITTQGMLISMHLISYHKRTPLQNTYKHSIYLIYSHQHCSDDIVDHPSAVTPSVCDDIKYIVRSHPCYSYLQTVHHAIVGAMVRLLIERELSLPSSNLVPIAGMSGPGQVSHASEIPQLVTSCYWPASCIVEQPLERY